MSREVENFALLNNASGIRSIQGLSKTYFIHIKVHVQQKLTNSPELLAEMFLLEQSLIQIQLKKHTSWLKIRGIGEVRLMIRRFTLLD